VNQKKSFKPIPLSMRDRKRYVLFQLIPLNSKKVVFSVEEVKKALSENFLQLFGEIGLARKGYQFISFNSKNFLGIIRCKHLELEEIKSGLLFLKEVKGKAVIPRILRVSGTLKTLKSKTL
jgi:RNase P/RNase MRP subunit POP5